MSLNRLQNSIYSALPVSTQNLLCTADGYRRSRQRFTSYFEATLAAWENSVSDPVEAHHLRQWESLKALLLRAREQTRYYRFLPDPIESGDPASSIADTLKQIPILEKSVYRARAVDFIAQDMSRFEYQERSTSGTTGTALRIFDSNERFSENYAAVWRQRRNFGVTQDDSFLAFTGQVTTPLTRHDPPFWRSDYYSKRTLFSIYHMSPENLAAYLDPIHSIMALLTMCSAEG